MLTAYTSCRLLQVGLSSNDALVVRHSCLALTQLAALPHRLSPTSLQPILQALAAILLGNSLQHATWFTAAEAAMETVYVLHPAPQELAGAVLGQLGRTALGGRHRTSKAQAVSK